MPRKKTREVLVGNVGVGGENPIRIQSMTTSNTRDVQATVDQILRLREAGCEIVRMTVQGMKEVEACAEIRSLLLEKGCHIPLVADIHFYPPAAMKVVEWVDKIRINPGNFIDKRALFIKKEYDDESYAEESKKIEETFGPLVLKCKALKKAIRIGTNHGSLSDRIMNRYGDTPKGMVESALEFARVCRSHDFHDVIFSMKASNPIVMIEAYRLLSSEMDKLGWDYPLHLGVTEAGEGEDGRIKSALGIGSLLIDGIGDTIRVSLTEDPWAEIDPCKRLSQLAFKEWKKESFSTIPKEKDSSKSGIVILPVDQEELSHLDFLQNIDCKAGRRGLFTPDFLWVEEASSVEGLYELLTRMNIGILSRTLSHPLVTKIKKIQEITQEDDISSLAILVDNVEEKTLSQLKDLHPKLYLFSSEDSLVHEGRKFFARLRSCNSKVPAILLKAFEGDFEDAVIESSAECGSLLIDGQFEGIALQLKEPLERKISLSFSLLQAARRKTVKTEFISCPGCGRTLFDLQSVSKRIRDKTSHLPGVRIAIMGCIVNGPGEMADADFGYVGSRPGKVDLYIGKACVEKNIDFAEADERLIALIKQQGKWVDRL
ncbi:MAG: (E)-4-hydroxy-3-methylbut-2-enyl-diphosphate synthase [Chlamydiota bacterium]